MQPVIAVVEGLARADANVLITGEHGSGKEVLARWLHAMSDRGTRPLVPVRAGVCVAFGLETTLLGGDGGGQGGCMELAEGASRTGGEVLRSVPGEWLQPFLVQRYDEPQEGIEVTLASEGQSQGA